MLFGLLCGAFFAFLVAAIPQPSGAHYYWQIMLPGSVLGLIVGYATQRYGRAGGAGPSCTRVAQPYARSRIRSGC